MYKGSRKRGKGREENRIRKESKNDQKATRRRPEGDQKTARKRSKEIRKRPKEIRKRPERDQKETTIPHIHIYYGNDIPIGISNVIETKMNENKQK